MIFNLFLWSLIFIIFYEILPDLLCQLNNGKLDHFAGTVQCNSGIESITLLVSVITLLLLMLNTIKNNELVINKFMAPPPRTLQKIAIISTSVSFSASSLLWIKTGFELIPDNSSRNSLVVLYHSVFGNPLISPFLYISIITTTYLNAVYNKKTLWIICTLSITFGCYITMSRGFILSAILPYIITQRAKNIIKFAPLIIFVFFLRDILNGSLITYIDSEADILNLFVDALGEFTNTYFGRRYFIDNNIDGNFLVYLLENIIKSSGLYYIFIPFFKLFASVDIALPSSTLSVNNEIEKNLGLTGFAGSFLSDLVIFFPVSIILVICIFIILPKIYRSQLNNMEKYIFLLLASMLLPNAFRWSITGYASMLTGIIIGYAFLKFLLFRRQ